MADGINGGNNGLNWMGRWLIGGGSFVTVVLAFGVSVSKDASIALDVARQHGQEILQIETRILQLEQELAARTQMRYTSMDAERDQRHVEFRFTRNEANIAKCIKHIDEHE